MMDMEDYQMRFRGSPVIEEEIARKKAQIIRNQEPDLPPKWFGIGLAIIGVFILLAWAQL